MSANLQNVQNALYDFTIKKYRSIRQSTSAHGIDKSTVAHRLHGRIPRAQSHSSLMRVTPAQEEVLVKWLEDLQRQVLPLNHDTLGELVVQLLHENDDFKPLGQHWTTRFLQRYPSLQTSYGRPIDIQRLLSLDPNIITTYFNKVAKLRHQYRIELDDIWNMDEKGFQIGQCGGE
jgi:Tc5 transposase DNA-binding domain